MCLCDAFWQVFAATGHGGAYLLYRAYGADQRTADGPTEDDAEDEPLSLAMGGDS